MGLRLKTIKRSIFLFLLSSVLIIFLLLNLMTAQLQPPVHFKRDAFGFPRDRKVLVSEISDSIYKAQIQRKPKTTNFEDFDEDNLSFKKNLKSQSVIEENNEADATMKEFIKKESNIHYNSEAIDEMENIDNQYEEDNDDYSDEKNEDIDDYDHDEIADAKPEIIDLQQYRLKTNPVFKPGDFGDIKGLAYFRKPKLQFEEIQSNPLNKEAPAFVENDIYWSTYVESQVPKGLSYAQVTKLIRTIRSTPVQRLKASSWNRCGRDKNAFITLTDNSNLCVRYRHPHYSFIFGEVLSFYLSRLIGMDNVPAVVLATTNSTSPQWRVANLTEFEWENNITVALIQWIDNLDSGIRSRAVIPDLILQAYKTGQPIKPEDIERYVHENTRPRYIPSIVQWSTMFIFDYLTGNYDRVASMQDAADKEHKPSIIAEPVRNLKKSSTDEKLWLVDNECGLFDAYELLRNTKGNYSTSRFSVFHSQTLQTMCVFQAHVVQALRKLYSAPAPHERLLNFALSLEPLLQNMPRNDHYFKLFTDLFKNRVKEVLDWVDKCQNLSDNKR